MNLIENVPDIAALGLPGFDYFEWGKLTLRRELPFRRAGPVFDVGFFAPGVARKGEEYVFPDLGCQVECLRSVPGLLPKTGRWRQARLRSRGQPTRPLHP